MDYGVPQDRERIILFGVKYELLDSDRRVAAKKLKEKFTWGDNDKYKKQNREKCSWPVINRFVERSLMDQPHCIIPELSVEFWFRKNDVYNHYNATDFF